MIAVTFAHPSESRHFVRLFGGRHPEVKIFHTGVGVSACRARLGPFLEAHRFELVISSGFAGGVDCSLGVGDLLLAENFSDPNLLAQALEAVMGRVGKMVTADHIIESAAERKRFATEHGAVAVDMETAWIAQACAERGLPLLSLRAISDTAAAPFPAPPKILFDLERQSTDLPKLGAHLLRHPASVVRLARFARQIAAVRVQLALGLSVVILELP